MESQPHTHEPLAEPLPAGHPLTADCSGASCVENYCIARLGAIGWPIEGIFAGSLVSFQELYCYFVEQKRPYAYFPHILKVHEWLRDQGCLEIVRVDRYDPDACAGEGNLVLLEVGGHNTEKWFSKKVWREDHYLLLEQSGNGERAALLNDLPPQKITVTNEWLAGRAFPALVIRPKACPDRQALGGLREQYREKAGRILAEGPAQLTYRMQNAAGEDPVALRDMLLLSILSAKRLAVLTADPALSLWISRLSKLCAKLQYCMLRKRPVDPEEALAHINRAVQAQAAAVWKGETYV